MAQHDWYLLEGSPRKISALYHTLAGNSHFLVSGTRNTLYLKIQHEEALFATGVAKSHGIRAKLTPQPEFDTAPCGKRTIDTNKHRKACKGCKRLRGNDHNAIASRILRAADFPTKSTDYSQFRTKQEIHNATFDPIDKPEARSPDGKFQSGLGSTQPINPLIPPPPRSVLRREENRAWQNKSGDVTTLATRLSDSSESTVEETAIEGVTREERHIWDRLRRQTKSTLNEHYRWGLISANGTAYESAQKYICLACRAYFPTLLDGRTHPCGAEKRFRDFTGRQFGSGSLSRSRSKKARPSVATLPVVPVPSTTTGTVDNVENIQAPSVHGTDGPTVELVDEMAVYYMALSLRYERLAELMKSLNNAKDERQAADRKYEETRKTLLAGV